MPAASIRGSIVEKQTGKPLARSLVVAQPVPGTRGATRSARTNPNGLFEIADVPAGLYIVTASKTGFVPTEYGQKRWFSAGLPVKVLEDVPAPVKIALPHFGAVTGRVVDENNLGISGFTVMAYRNSRPPVLVGKSSTDDRGVYRIGGLMPGFYLTRTDNLESDVGNYRATFGNETLSVDAASTAEVVLDQDTLGADIRPLRGLAVSVSGQVMRSGSARGPATVTLVNDMGQLNTSSESGRFQFEHLATGPVELLAQASDRQLGPLEGYLSFDLQGSRGVQLEVAPLPSVQFHFVDTSGRAVDPATLPVLIRRMEISGPGAATYLTLDGQRQSRLRAGRWELAVAPNADWYAADFSGPGRERSPEMAAGWNEIVVDPRGSAPEVKFVLSSETRTLHGTVTYEDVPVAGAPVHLEAFNAHTGRRIRDLRTMRSDVNGRFSFAGLAPGSYRLLASFDYLAPETSQMTKAGALEIVIGESRDTVRDLKLWSME